MKKRNFWKIPMAVFAVFTVICVAAIPITNYFAPMINVALNAETQRIIPDPDAQIFYWTRYDSEEELVANDWNVCRQVMAEGASVLLNRDDTLPLAADTKFSCFSQSSVDPVKVGTGSAFVSTGEGGIRQVFPLSLYLLNTVLGIIARTKTKGFEGDTNWKGRNQSITSHRSYDSIDKRYPKFYQRIPTADIQLQKNCWIQKSW